MERAMLLVVLFVFMWGGGDGCEAGWDGNRGMCYLFVDDRRTWPDARDTCDLYGGQLVHIYDADDNDFIATTLTANDYTQMVWTAANDIATEGHFEFDPVGDNVTWTNWGNNQPNNLDPSTEDDADCVSIIAEGLWWDFSCSREFGFLCERVDDEDTTTVAPTSTAEQRGGIRVHDTGVYVRRHDIGCLGDDFARADVPSVTVCARTCSRRPECEAFTFHGSSGGCRLYQAVCSDVADPESAWRVYVKQ